MGLIHIQPSRNAEGAPECRQMIPAAAATFRKGAPLARDGSVTEHVTEHAGGATVTGLIGFAGARVTAGVPDFGATIPVYLAEPNVDWLMQVYDTGGGALRTVSGDGTFEGNEYGFIKVSNEWYLDEDDTTAKIFRVVKELPEINAVLCRLIPSVIGQ